MLMSLMFTNPLPVITNLHTIERTPTWVSMLGSTVLIVLPAAPSTDWKSGMYSDDLSRWYLMVAVVPTNAGNADDGGVLLMTIRFASFLFSGLL